MCQQKKIKTISVNSSSTFGIFISLVADRHYFCIFFFHFSLFLCFSMLDPILFYQFCEYIFGKRYLPCIYKIWHTKRILLFLYVFAICFTIFFLIFIVNHPRSLNRFCQIHWDNCNKYSVNSILIRKRWFFLFLFFFSFRHTIELLAMTFSVQFILINSHSWLKHI